MKKTVKDIDVSGKKVLVRNDFNVPLIHGEVSDDTRIRAALPTIEYLIEQNAAIVLCSHLGRPKGTPEEKYRMKPVARRLTEILNTVVGTVDDCIGPRVEAMKNDLVPGEILLLENTRFHAGEKKNDAGFAAELAKGMDIFVNDAFGAAHRAHASTEGVARHLPAVAGLLMDREISVLQQLVDNPETPITAIFGGAKISDKIGVLERFIEKADYILIGGGMANTFLKARGLEVGQSFLAEEDLDTAKEILEKAGDKLILPVDVVVTKEIKKNADCETVSVEDVPADGRIADVGSGTVDLFIEKASGSRTVLWNGPLGVFETPPFDKGTTEVARRLGDLDVNTYVGGGDSVAAVNNAGVENRMAHVSTGGGAFLEFMEGKTLPGVAALQDK